MNSKLNVVILVAALLASACSTVSGNTKGGAESSLTENVQPIEKAKESLEAHPESASANYEMARSLYADRSFAEADQYAQRATELAPSDPEKLLLLAEIRANEGRPIDAAEKLREAVKLDPKAVPKTRYIAALEKGFKQAEELRMNAEQRWLADELRRVAPESSVLKKINVREMDEGIALDLENSGKLREAVTKYEELRKQYPQHVSDYSYEIGRLRLALGEKTEATAAFQDAIEATMKDKRIDLALKISQFAKENNQPEIAVFFLEQLAQKGKSIEEKKKLYTTIFILKTSLENFDGQLSPSLQESINEYLKLFPPKEKEKGYAELAALFANLRKYDLMDEIIKEADKKSMNGWEITSQKLSLLAIRGDDAGIELTARKFSERTDIKNAALLVIKWAYERKIYPLARAISQSEERKYGNDVDFWYYTLLTYAESLNYPQTRRAFNKYIKLQLETKDQYHQILYALNKNKLTDEAEQLIKKAKVKWPADDTILLDYADLLVTNKKDKELDKVFIDYMKLKGSEDKETKPAEAGETTPYRIAEWLAKNDKDTLAIKYYKLASKEGDNLATFKLWRYYKAIGDTQHADECFDILVRSQDLDYETLITFLSEALQTNMPSENLLKLLERLYNQNKKTFPFLMHLEYSYFSFFQYKEMAKLIVDSFYIYNTNKSIDAFETLLDYIHNFKFGNSPYLYIKKEMARLANREPKISRQLALKIYDIYSEDQRIMNRSDLNKMLENSLMSDNNGQNDDEELLDYADKFYNRMLYKLSIAAASKVKKENQKAIAFFIIGKNQIRLNEIEEAHSSFHQSLAIAKTTGNSTYANIIRKILEFLINDSNQIIDAKNYIQLAKDNFSEETISSVYTYLIKYYSATNQTQQISQTTDWFLSNTPDNYTNAQRTVISTLASISDQETFKRINQFLDAPAGNSLLDLSNVELLQDKAKLLYKMNRPEEAETAFEDAASETSKPENIWANAGAFYENSLDFQRAIEAYTRAIDADPSYLDAKIARAKLFLKIGDLEKGSSSFKSIIANFDYQTKITLSQTYIESLQKSGFLDKSCQEAEKLYEKHPELHEILFQQFAFCFVNKSNDVKLKNLISSASTSTNELNILAKEIAFNGDVKLAAQIVSDRMALGSSSDILQLLRENEAIVAQRNGYKTIQKAFSILNSSNDRYNNNYVVPFGSTTYALHSRRYDEARRLLKTDPTMWNPKKSLLNHLGYSDEYVINFYRDSLSMNPGIPVLNHLLYQFANTDSIKAFDKFAELYSDFDALKSFYTFKQIYTSLTSGKDAANAVAAFYKVVDSPTPAAPSDVINLATPFIEYGYSHELVPFAQKLIDTNSYLLNDSNIRRLVLVIALSTGEMDLTNVLNSLPFDSLSFSNEQKIVDTLLLFYGKYRLIMHRVKPDLLSKSFELQTHAVKVYASALFGLRKYQEIDSLINQYLTSNSNPLEAKKQSFQILLRFGRVDAAKNLYSQIMFETKATSRKNNLFSWYSNNDAPLSKIKDASRQLLKTYSSRNINESAKVDIEKPQLIDFILIRKEISYLYSIAPNSPVIKKMAMLLNYQNGNVEHARKLLLELTSEFKNSPYSLNDIVVDLFNYNLFGELAAVFPKNINVEVLYPPTFFLLAKANYKIGRVDAAENLFNLYFQRQKDKSAAASAISFFLNSEGDHNRALVWANNAVKLDPNNLQGTFELGITKLHLQDISGAQLVDSALHAGYIGKLSRVIVATSDTLNLEATIKRYQEYIFNRPFEDLGPLSQIARKHPYMLRPILDQLGTLYSAQKFGYSTNAEFLRSKIAKMNGDIFDQALLYHHWMNFSIATIFYLDDEGNISEKDLYDRLDNATSILNNFAYDLSNFDKKTNFADSLIHRSLASDLNDNMPSFKIDTFAWIQFKLKNYSMATKFLELTGYDSGKSAYSFDRGEYYQHLALLRQRLGGKSFGMDSATLFFLKSMLSLDAQ